MAIAERLLGVDTSRGQLMSFATVIYRDRSLPTD